MVKQPYEGLFKKVVLRSFSKFTRKHLCQNLLVFSCQVCRICKNTFLAEQYRMTDSIIAVSIVAKGVLGNETVNYDTQTKAHVLI